MYLKAAINGGRRSTPGLAVPETSEQIAQVAREAIACGASVVHAHARDAAGLETIEPVFIRAMIDATHAVDPGIVIGTTTGLWACRDHSHRLACIGGWSTPPDFASVAYREEGADEAALLLVDRGIPLESAIWSLSDLPALLDSRVLDKNIRILIEPDDRDPEEAVRTCRIASTRLRSAGVDCPILYHGEDATVWPVVRAAIEDGAQVRVGLEDGIELPDGTRARGNGDLIRAALAEAEAARTNID